MRHWLSFLSFGAVSRKQHTINTICIRTSHLLSHEICFYSTCKGVMVMMTVYRQVEHSVSMFKSCSWCSDVGRDTAERRKANKDILFYLVGVFLHSVVIINTYIPSKIHVLPTGCVSWFSCNYEYVKIFYILNVFSQL